MKVSIRLVFFGLILGIVWGITSFMMNLNFKQNCEGHLKRAADSNTIELAEAELDKALKYMEATNLTSGSTAVLFNLPEHDIEFWYTNIKTSYDELAALPDTASSLEKSNMLLKLRETLLDHDKDGDEVTLPPRIGKYPNHILMYVLGWISVLLIAPFGFYITIMKS